MAASISLLHFNKLSSSLSFPLLSSTTSSTSIPTISPNTNFYSFISTNRKSTQHLYTSKNELLQSFKTYSRRASIEDYNDQEEDDRASFEDAVALFNKRDYYKCHDSLELIWNESQDPIRTLVHGILQCSVGFHHLFNQNHKGAMMELGEGLCKLRKMNLDSGPFYEFEKQISSVLDFIYQTQLELAACTDDFCITMDQSESSYKLLGGYAAGQRVYWLESDGSDSSYIVFRLDNSAATGEQPKVRLPVLNASEEHLLDFQYD